MTPTISPGDSGITIEGHVGTWHTIYSYRSPAGVIYHALEHDFYGSDAEWLYVNANGEEVTDEAILEAITDGEFEEVN